MFCTARQPLPRSGGAGANIACDELTIGREPNASGCIWVSAKTRMHLVAPECIRVRNAFGA
jgi:hypothetical protein